MTNMDLELAPGWRPEEGDTIVGTVLGVDRMRSNQGAQDYYPVVTIKPEGKVRVEEGEEPVTVSAVAVHAFHNVLQDRLMSQRPQVGERIGIKFVQKQPTRDGKRTVAVYIVKVDRQGGDAWAVMGNQQANPRPASDIPVSDGDFQPPAPGSDDDIPF